MHVQRTGFTLIEVMVALVVGGIVLVTVHACLNQLADVARLTVAAAAANDSTANGERVLRALLGRVDGATFVPGAVQGTPMHADLTTWCEVPRGWLEQCQVRVSLVNEQGGLALAATMPDHRPPYVLIRGFRKARILYLSDARNGGVWLSDWHSRLTTPLALGFVLDRDTMILRIGERG